MQDRRKVETQDETPQFVSITVEEAQHLLREVLRQTLVLQDSMEKLNNALRNLPTQRAGVITQIDDENVH